MNILARFRSPRCDVCGRKLADCPRARYDARRVDVGRLRELSPVAAAVIEEGRRYDRPDHLGKEDGV